MQSFTTKLLPLLALASLPLACTLTSTGTPTGADAGADAGETCKGDIDWTFTIDGLPAGIAADVRVVGAGGTQLVTQSTTLHLANGEYKASLGVVAEPDPIVRKAYRASQTSVTLCSETEHKTTTEVHYELIETSHKVWVDNTQKAETLLGFDASNLAASGSPAAAVAAKVNGAGRAFDHEGNLWVANGATIERIAARDVGLDRVPNAIVSSPAFEGGTPAADAMAFDPDGNLWVTVKFASTIVKFNAADLATGSRTPSVVLSGYKGPTSIAFDGAGNLFVVGDSGLQRFSAARLAASSDAQGDGVIEAKTPLPVESTLAGATGLAFDASKNLWVAYGAILARFSPSELEAGTRSVTPSVQVTTDVLALPEQIAFDESGSLWFAYAAGKFASYTKEQLNASGTKTPSIIVSSPNTGYATDILFYPAPAALPLFSSVK